MDLFADRDKAYYAKYKVGIQERPPTFEDDVEWEQDLQEGIQQLQLAGRPETYLRDINSTISAGAEVHVEIYNEDYAIFAINR